MDKEKLFVPTGNQVWKDYPKFTKEVDENRQLLLKLLNEEVKKPIRKKNDALSEFESRSPWRDSVYFYPTGGFFIYNDKPIHFDIVFGLIEVGLLKFYKIDKHQGEMMPRYGLG